MKKRSGDGLKALFGKIDTNISTDPKTVVESLSNTIVHIPVGNIEENPFQPRTEFDPQALKELSDSIREHGLIQPITVRHLEGDKFQLISGERRWRASKMAGLEEVPAYVRIANDETMLELALIENIQRQDLNAIEIAITFKRLMEEFSLTHEQLSDRVGKERSTITNYVNLLRLPPEVQQGVQQAIISMGHAKAIRSVADILLQVSLYKEIVDKGLSVRQAEALAQRYKEGLKSKASEGKADNLTVHHQALQDKLSSFLSTKVLLKRQKDGQGQIVIHFQNDQHLNHILDLMEDGDKA